MDHLARIAWSGSVTWNHYLECVWPYVGVAFSLMLWMAWLLRKTDAGRLSLLGGVGLFIFQPGFYFLLPSVSERLWWQSYYVDTKNLWAFCAGAIVTAVLIFATARYGGAAWDDVKRRLTRRSSLERNQRTDVRSLSRQLPKPGKNYDPTRHIRLDLGIFMGLDEQRRPIYIPWELWRRCHAQIFGTTGSGKGVLAQGLLVQAVLNGESAIAIDPKGDDWLPYALQWAAKQAGVPFFYIDLAGNHPQWHPLHAKSALDIEELLNAAFALGERGEAADFYRLRDRKASRLFAGLPNVANEKLSDGLTRLLMTMPEQGDSAEKFVSDLEEVALMPVVSTADGIDLPGVLESGAVIYVRGSMRNPRVQKLQKMFVVSVIQIAAKREPDSGRQLCLFLDEFKYQISRPVIELLDAIRSKRAHVVIAHQSLGNLRDCPADLDPDSVVASVNENCAIKIAYTVRDPDTAEWLARMSGQIQVDDEVREMTANIGLAETRANSRTLRQAERPLIDTNMLMMLPERCAVLFGVGVAKFIFTAPVKVERSPEAVRPWQCDALELESSPQSVKRAAAASQSLAGDMINVD